MENTGTFKNVFNNKPETTRQAELPKLMCEVRVNKGIRMFGVRNGKTATMNKNECQEFLKKDNAHIWL